MRSTSDLVLLDGGMGKHLERSGAPFRQPEWSALALMEAPELVLEAHRAFIAAGADVIVTNTYAVVPFHIGDERFAERGSELAALAGRLARQAADESDRPVRVAGSLPPMFGSYQPELFDANAAPAMLAMLVEAQAPYVDLWVGETLSLIGEALAVTNAVASGPGPNELWLSFTVPDSVITETITLRSGESIADMVSAVAGRCDAILFNCSPPEMITLALEELSSVLMRYDPNVRSSLRVGAYANGFEPKPPGHAANETLLGRRDDLTPESYLATAQRWVDGGASIIGGCCHMHVEHIDALHAGLRRTI